MLGLALVGIVLALYIGMPTAMGVVVAWPSRASVGEAPDGFETVVFEREDGTELAGWYLPPRNGSAIIVVHGAGGSRESVRRQTEMLAENGYGVLAVDMSGHGESEGRVNRLGWKGTEDVRAAVDFLIVQPGVERIGAYGSSMGGEALLGASAECPEIEAIVTDGATRRSIAELLALPSERPLVRNFTARVMYAAAEVFTGQRPPAPLLGEMERTATTRFLLIAGGSEELEVPFNQLFASRLGSRADLWVVPGVGHTGALASNPAEYEDRLVSFFDRELGR